MEVSTAPSKSETAPVLPLTGRSCAEPRAGTAGQHKYQQNPPALSPITWIKAWGTPVLSFHKRVKWVGDFDHIVILISKSEYK